METPIKTGVFIFTRDLRIVDNNALEIANKECDIIIPIFIFTNKQVKTNKYKSDKAYQFMIECIDELNTSIKKQSGKLILLKGELKDTIANILKELQPTKLYITKDYTPFANYRESIIDTLCKKYLVEFNCIEDYLLYENPSISGKYYQKFTPYYNSKINIPVKAFAKKHKIKWLTTHHYTISNTTTIEDQYLTIKDLSFKSKYLGGRKQALKILNNIKAHKDYGETRNDLNKETTGLSAYMKFGCISSRETFHILKNNLGLKHDLIKQLIWREFYLQLIIGFPRVLQGKSLKEKYDNIKWTNNTELYIKWCNGETGFPIVDAGMREMNETGFMHNRARLITASFLVKNLNIDWRLGEQYFATKLIDYDPASNNGNWQWVAGTGADSMPYFRIFNPWTQGKTYDKDAIYIKKWVKELYNIEPKHIHQWDNPEIRKLYPDTYYEPIIDYSKSRKDTLELYKKYL